METKSKPKTTGKRFKSVEDMINALGTSDDVRKAVSRFEAETNIVHQLALLRQKAGLTQEQMAERLGVTQSAISKLENGPDEDLSLRHVEIYAEATGQRLHILFGKPLNHVEAIKTHVFSIQDRLRALAELANEHDELEPKIRGFFAEAWVNIFDILAKCTGNLPSKEQPTKARIRVLRDAETPQTTSRGNHPACT